MPRRSPPPRRCRRRASGLLIALLLAQTAVCAEDGAEVHPDLEAAVEALDRRVEERVLGAPVRADLHLVLWPRLEAADPLRTLEATRSWVDRLRARGADAELVRDEAPREHSTRVEVEVVAEGAVFVLRARSAELGGLPFAAEARYVEKAWVRGTLPDEARYCAIVRGNGSGAAPEAAREEARRAAGERLLAALGADSGIDAERLLARLGAWELDRFEGGEQASGTHRAAVLVGLDREELESLRREVGAVRREAVLQGILRGAAGLVWVLLCFGGFARADLATRGFLSLPLGALFTLAGLGGILFLLAGS